MARLEVEIVGDISSLEKSLNKADKDLKEFDKDVKSSSRNIDRSLNATSQSFGGLQKGVANATPTLTEFSRVIQDAPFGIQGVANNITQLTSNFGNLTKRAGGSKNAFKLLLSSLTGPAGILLAVSTITSLLVSFGDQLFNTSKEEEDLADSTKKTTEELQNQKGTLDALIQSFNVFRQGQERTNFNTIKEREDLRALTRNVLDYTQSEETRNRALNELIKSYSKYFKGLNINQTNAILKAEANVTKVLERKEKTIQTLNQLEVTGRQLQLKRLEIEKLQADGGSKQRVSALQNEILELRNLQKQLREALELYKSFNLETQGVAVERSSVTGLDTSGLAVGTNPFLQISNNIQESLPTIKEGLGEIELALANFNNQVRNIIGTEIANTFSGIGQAIGNSLSGAGNLAENLGKVLLGAIGSLAIRVGKLAIGIGVTLKGIKNALTSLNPAAAIGAGIALVAIGTAFSNAARSLGSNSFSSGGASGVTTSRVGTSPTSFSGSSSTFTNQGFDTSRFVFEIKGTSLVSVIQNTLEVNRNLGGSLFLNPS